MKKISQALISVSNKHNLKKIITVLKKYRIKILSSGGTFKEIKKISKVNWLIKVHPERAHLLHKSITSTENEFKKIVANVQKGVYGNTKNIKKNKLASSQMKGAVMADSDMDTSDEEAEAEQDEKICDKYPEGC